MEKLGLGTLAHQCDDICAHNASMDSQRRFAAYTGAACIDWCGHETRSTFSVAGNMLAGAAVLAETVRAYEANTALPFARRLIVAMRAGEAACGDKRGKQSAALLIHDGESYPLYDLRVDGLEDLISRSIAEGYE